MVSTLPNNPLIGYWGEGGATHPAMSKSTLDYSNYMLSSIAFNICEAFIGLGGRGEYILLKRITDSLT